MSAIPPPPPPVGPDDATYAGGPTATYYAPSTGLATTSLVLGLLSIPTNCICIGPLLGILAVILGIVALARASADPHQYGGKGLAVGGVVSGGLSVLLTITISIAFAVGGLSLGGIMAQSMGVGEVAVNLENVGKAVQAYQAAHDEYPPDLQALVDADLIAQNPVPGASNDPIDGMLYVTDLQAGDPSHWILAYEPTAIFGVKLVGVLYHSGQTDMLEQTEFARDWERFKQEYERDRGVPPVVLKSDSTLLMEPESPPIPEDAPPPDEDEAGA